MKLKLKLPFKDNNLEDEFQEDLSQVAYKDGKIYRILVSGKSYCVGNLLGRLRVVVKNEVVLHWIYPLMGGGDYEILDQKKITRMEEILFAYNKFGALNWIS